MCKFVIGFLTKKCKLFSGRDKLEAMLQGRAEPDFERAVFVSENAYHNNGYAYEDFRQSIDFHLHLIKQLIAANDKSDSIDFNVKVNAHGRFKMDALRHLPKEKKELYQKTLTNWAIFKYITDTVAVYPFYHLPFTYATHDPFGIKDWSNSQVINLLASEEQKGNCYALTALFKILSDRLNADARLCTAPQHIYIQHRDPKGDYYNVELATAGHPGDGSLQTLTHTTTAAIMSGIALRSYDAKQSIGLCLVNLAKSYEHTFGTKDDAFILKCAELALMHDSLNLNALLLKQQVLDARVAAYAAKNNISDIEKLKADTKISKTFSALENHLALLYRLGYRQMPLDMQTIIMTGEYPENYTDKNPNPFTTIDPKDEHRKEYKALYGGLFQEVFEKNKLEYYGHFVFSTAAQTISAVDTSAHTGFLIDPVAFAYDFGARMYDSRLGIFTSVDPKARTYPSFSPYVAMANNPILFVDNDGQEPSRKNATNLENYISKLRTWGSKGVTSFSELFGAHGAGYPPGIGPAHPGIKERYLYSPKWGWIDMKHFASGAFIANQPHISIEGALKRMENNESVDANSPHSSRRNSAYDYEDLVSNLLGVYFQVYSKQGDNKKKDLLTNLKEYLTQLGFNTEPTTAPNYLYVTETNDTETGEINPTYNPKHTTQQRNSKLDREIILFKDQFIRGKTDRRSDKDRKKMESEAAGKKEFIGTR